VVDFEHERLAATIESVDEGEMPQWTVAIETAAGETGAQLVQLLGPPGQGKGGATQVMVEVDVRSLD
jgi:hypothetical protein